MEDRYERSRAIGQALARGRKRARKSIRQCAEYLGTSRRRYTNIEQGTAFIAAVELEDLVRFLGLPPREVWPEDLLEAHASTRQVVVEAQPGESVQILVDIAPVASASGKATGRSVGSSDI